MLRTASLLGVVGIVGFITFSPISGVLAATSEDVAIAIPKAVDPPRPLTPLELAGKSKAELTDLVLKYQGEDTPSTERTATSETDAQSSSPRRSALIIAGGFAAAFIASSLLSHRSDVQSAFSDRSMASRGRLPLATAPTTPTSCNTNVSFTNCTAYPLHQTTCNTLAAVTSSSALDTFLISNSTDRKKETRERVGFGLGGLGLHIIQIAANCTNGQPAQQSS